MTVSSSATTNRPKAFISYSHTNTEHVRWVVELAERLTHDGVQVVLDKWDLKPGHDAIVFMEQMITDSSIEFVLLVCDQRYQEKADGRDGGVGTESQIISRAVYEKVNQEKFIPVIKENDDVGKPCTPVFVGGRIHINLSDESTYEAEYEKLLRHLWKKPLSKRPVIGEMPAYLKEDVPESSPLTGKVKRACNLLETGNPRAMSAVREAFLLMIEDLKLQRITYASATEDYDETVLSSVTAMIPVREAFVELVTMSTEVDMDSDAIHKFFEDLISLFYPVEGTTSHRELDFDNFRFFGYEILLHYLAILIKAGRFKAVTEFLGASFFKQKYGNLEPTVIFEEIRSHIGSLDKMRNVRLKLNRTSVVADEIKRRATNTRISFQDLQTADSVIYAHSLVNSEQCFRFFWPVTMVFRESHGRRPELFAKLVSKRHFERIKDLFCCVDSEELKKKVQEAQTRIKNSGISYGIDSRWLPGLEELFDLQKLSSLP